EREIEIARARTVGVERRAVFPPVPGDGTPAQNDSRAGRNHLVDRSAELLEARSVSAESEPDDVFPLLIFGQSALHLFRGHRILHGCLGFKIDANTSLLRCCRDQRVSLQRGVLVLVKGAVSYLFRPAVNSCLRSAVFVIS